MTKVFHLPGAGQWGRWDLQGTVGQRHCYGDYPAQTRLSLEWVESVNLLPSLG
jgi:hypothetical protein